LYKGLKCAAIIPAFNEQNYIYKVITTIPDFIDKIIVVNDGSHDKTRELVALCSTNDNRIHLIHHERNLGVGCSIKAGYKIALDSDVVLSVIIAGDGQMNPSYIRPMFDTLIDKEVDVVKGNRLYFSKELFKMPIIRLTGNLFLTLINKIFFKMFKINDPQNGFVAIRLRILSLSLLEQLDSGYLFETTFLRMVKRNKLKILDLKIPAKYNAHHSSLKIRFIIAPLLRLYISELAIFRFIARSVR